MEQEPKVFYAFFLIKTYVLRQNADDFDASSLSCSYRVDSWS